VDAPHYDFATQTRIPGQNRVLPRPFIVVEGILLLADPDLRRRLHYTVFVDTPDDIRAVRRIRRDVAERGQTVDAVVAKYLATVRPMHEQFVAPSMRYAERVLDGTAPVEQLVYAVLNYIPHGKVILIPHE